jgi:hypothetical protein
MARPKRTWFQCNWRSCCWGDVVVEDVSQRQWASFASTGVRLFVEFWYVHKYRRPATGWMGRALPHPQPAACFLVSRISGVSWQLWFRPSGFGQLAIGENVSFRKTSSYKQMQTSGSELGVGQSPSDPLTKGPLRDLQDPGRHRQGSVRYGRYGL